MDRRGFLGRAVGAVVGVVINPRLAVALPADTVEQTVDADAAYEYHFGVNVMFIPPRVMCEICGFKDPLP